MKLRAWVTLCVNVGSVAILGGTAFMAPAAAADFPAKPVRIITQGAAGSGPDVIARIVADHLAKRWRQPALIVNHPGAGGIVAARAAAAADPDGYTLYLPTITAFVIMPELHAKLPFDMERDFARIGFVGETPMMIAVAPSLGVKTLPDLIALTKTRPAELFYAANTRGSLPHLAGELFRSRAGVELNFVAYPGASAGLQDLMGGRIAMIVESVGALAGAVQAGTIRPLAIASKERLPNFPDVPTVAETHPDFLAMGWFVLAAPAATPAAIVRTVNQDLNAVLAVPELKQRFAELGAFVRMMSPAQTADFIRAEEAVWRPLVRKIGLKAQ